MKTVLHVLVTLFALDTVQPCSVSGATRYVWLDSPDPKPPYADWATAARVIQDAVDAAVAGDEIVVTNGTYASGGRAVFPAIANRVAVDKPLTLRSVSGPQLTMIQGAVQTRCAYLTNGASLSGFTLSKGATREWTMDSYDPREVTGGGVWCESTDAVVSNCVLTGNSAWNGGGAYGGTLKHCLLSGNRATQLKTGVGGGALGSSLYNCTLTGNTGDDCGAAYACTLQSCVLTGNSASYYGAAGGVLSSTLYNCTLVGNSGERNGGACNSTLSNCTLTGNTSVFEAGGAQGCTLNNCIIYDNTALFTPKANFSGGTLNYCCTTPQPTNGFGNVTNAPALVDPANGDFRLQSTSPCINAGSNAYARGSTDLDGNRRIVSGTVDIGAYESQGVGSAISYAWLQRYGLPTDGSADATDPDSDGLSTWQEWGCQTDPTNTLSVLRLLSATPAGTNVTVTWPSVAGVSYFLERSTDLGAPSPFTPLAANLLGPTGTSAFTDVTAAALPRVFYRVGVHSP